MHTVNFLINLVQNHQILIYGFIFLGLLFEGEFVLIASGILIHLGALNFIFTLIFVLLGGFCKTLIGYHIGRVIHKRWHETKFLKHIEMRVSLLMPRFNQRPFWSIFISKFIMGVNHVVIIFSGYIGIDYKKYLKAEISSTIIWAPVLLIIGYIFGYAALQVSREIWRFSLVALLLIIGFIIFDKIVSWTYEIFEEFYENKNDE